MKTEREFFEDWLKKEYPMIHQWYSDGLEEWKTKVEYMFVAWQASAQREGYKLVPVEINDEIESAMFSSVARGEMPCDIYKAMLEAVEK